MNSSDTRVSSYLDDLARMLTDLDPADRDEVLAGVREHLDATLAEHPDDPAAVDAALLRLGPPEQVAAQARADLAPTAHPSATAPALPPLPAPPTPGLARTAVFLVMLSCLPAALLLVADRLTVVFAPSGGMFGASLVPFLAGSVLFWPWLAGVVCTLIARGFTTRTRIALVAAGPVTTAVVALASFWLSPEPASTVVCLALLLADVFALLVLTVRAWREVGA